MPEILPKDSLIRFPQFTVLKASAGSGKTHTLTKRIVQFLLSRHVPKNGLRNVLAITFSNNAAKEMKERTLSWLKEVYFGDPAKLKELSGVVSLDTGEMQEKAGLLIDEILDNYSDFQVKTIDSFMTTVFKASAIDFGYNPDFDILLSNDSLMEYSFNLFLRDVRQGTDAAAYLEAITDSLTEQKKSEDAYIWDPSVSLLKETKSIYRKLSSKGKPAEIEEFGAELEKVKAAISSRMEEIEREIISAELDRHGNSSYRTILPLVRDQRFPDLIGKGLATSPVKKLSKKESLKQAAYDRVLDLWADVAEAVNRLTVISTRMRCAPYVRAYRAFSDIVDTAKRQQGKVFIEDINLHLAEYLETEIVPDVYFRIGETIYHFLIDEFQDTSPIQWLNLFPLIENSLSQGGSLFVVGDTKQAIYGFRNADYTIMKYLEDHNPFPSAEHAVKELDLNYRSRKRILEFNERVFKERLSQSPEYREAGARSGLTDYIQNPRDWAGDEGYAEVSLVERNADDPPERERIQEIIGELLSRGYQYRDIAILTQKNDAAVAVTTWLNEKDIPFISYSSLDVRKRKVTGEIISLINFLDSPLDDFAFGGFILGEIFSKAIAEDHPDAIEKLRQFCFSGRENPPLYKAFQEEFGPLWKEYFEGLFRSTGFLPLYDLVTAIFSVFRVFETLPDEEATLVKILELVKDFEGGGFNSLKDFLETAADDTDSESEWNLNVPKNTNAVEVMTIHKSKGLGFPVVIVLLYSVRNKGFEYIVEEKDEAVCLLRINEKAAGCDDTLQELYDRERMSEMVNRLNSLYVGFTRPKRELYVVGVRTRETDFPFPLLPSAEFPSSAPPSAGPDNRSAVAPDAPASCPLLHRMSPLELQAGSEEFLTIEERRRGEFIHKVLFSIGFIEEGFEAELHRAINRVREETGSGPTV
ncbi:MAG: UvrD-helicase domain-containing protein, partial [Thermodesulfovibrionales bacterium]